MTVADFLGELGRLEGTFVAVSMHPSASWNPMLHIQGVLRRDNLDDDPEAIAYSVGSEAGSIYVLPSQVEGVDWRDDLVPSGHRVLAVVMRSGALLTIGSFPCVVERKGRGLR